ncbi:MAG TPA: hypothetical protein V6D17_18460 [Candidatus Obscuribacterales bacterium]
MTKNEKKTAQCNWKMVGHDTTTEQPSPIKELTTALDLRTSEMASIEGGKSIWKNPELYLDAAEIGLAVVE